MMSRRFEALQRCKEVATFAIYNAFVYECIDGKLFLTFHVTPYNVMIRSIFPRRPLYSPSLMCYYLTRKTV